MTICPHCSIEIRLRELGYQGLLKSFRICPNCGGSFTVDTDTKYRQALFIFIAIISLAFTILLYFQGSDWLFPALFSYVVLGLLIYWGNKNLFLVPYQERSEFNQTDISKDLLFDFFLCFSKFEFALKTSGFAIGNEKKVSPNWDGFASSIKDSFDKSKSRNLSTAIDYFLNHPPWKQVLIDGAMHWDASVPDNGLSDIEKVLLLIRRVRNNLFHGGKFNFDIHEDKERTISLLKYSLVILEACIPLSSGVADNYGKAKI